VPNQMHRVAPNASRPLTRAKCILARSLSLSPRSLASPCVFGVVLEVTCARWQQFTALHKEPTPDPCAVAGIFGCNAGSMTHAARSGAGYVNINGYHVMPDGSVEAPGQKHEFD